MANSSININAKLVPQIKEFNIINKSGAYNSNFTNAKLTTSKPPNTKSNGFFESQRNAEQTKLLINIIKTEQTEKEYLNKLIDYLEKYIYILYYKIIVIKKYYFYHTFISISIFAFLILLYIFEKTKNQNTKI